MQKTWQVREKIKESDKFEFPEVNSIILQLLFNLGLESQTEIDEFLNPDYGDDSNDPFLFNDMAKAVRRILESAKNQERLMIYGDYDADGVCASVLLYNAFKKLGIPTEVYLPHREKEGYGLNQKACDYIIKQGVSLVVTVDCGISNRDEVKKLVDADIDVIILDHHHPPEELPKAYAILDAKLRDEKYPFKDLAGAGVAFKLIQALVREKALNIGQEKWLLDLVAIATVADCSPLISENRTLVKWGLVVLNKTRRLGLQKLIEAMSNELGKIGTYAIGYQIAPRLNAAGRMNHANSAFNLLIADSENDAHKLAMELNKENSERQRLTDRLIEEAKSQIEPFDAENKLIFAINPKKGAWPTGVVGLVAGKICEQYHRPTLVVGCNSEGGLVGSGRSIPEFNIIEAVGLCKEYLAHYGGHAGACGFTIKSKTDVESFKKRLDEIARQKLKDIELAPVLNIDVEVSLSEIDWKFFEQLENFEPFGEGNPKPKFLALDLEVAGFVGVGNGAKHLRLMLNQGNVRNRKTIGFCFGEWCERLKVGDKIDLVFEVGLDEWNGRRELQLKIVDLRLSDSMDNGCSPASLASMSM